MISSAIRSPGISLSRRRVCLETTAQSRYKLTGPSHNSFILVRARKTLPLRAISDFRRPLARLFEVAQLLGGHFSLVEASRLPQG